MADEFSVPVGTPAAESSIGGVPRRYVLLAGAGVAVAAVVLLARRGGGPDVPAAENVAPGTLTPDAAIALGSLEQQIRERSGRLEQQIGDSVLAQEARASALDDMFSGFREDVLGGFDRSERSLAALRDEMATAQAGIMSQLGIVIDTQGDVSDQISAAYANLSEGQRQIFDRQWATWQKQAAANYQIFQRASDPNWMPSESDPVFEAV